MIDRMAPRKQEAPYGVTDWGDRLWYLRDELGLSQESFGERCGVNRLAIRKLESGQVKRLTREAIEFVSKGLKVDKGAVEAYLLNHGVSLKDLMMAHRGRPLVQSDTHRALLKRFAERVGLPLEEVVALAGDGSATMNELSEIARRAVMGAVHMLGYPLETVTAAAKQVMAERGEALVDPEEWFTAIKKKLPAKAPSGTYPSSSKIKTAAAVKP